MRPLLTLTRFMRWGWRLSSPISWPMIGSDRPGISTRTISSSVVCTSATPSTRRSSCTSEWGARLTAAKTSAKRSSA
jgi:hypothetical protein